MTIINPPAWQQYGSYTAKMDRQVLGGFIGTAGVTTSTAYQIIQTTPAPSMDVTVRAGSAYVQGTEQASQGMYHVFNEEDFNINIKVANAINTRIDLVYIRVYDSEYSGTQNMAAVEVLEGVPSSSPVVPALPASSIPLAQITVPANATAIVTANIVNARPVAKFNTVLTRNFIQKPEPWRSVTSDGLYGSNWHDYPTNFQVLKYRKFAGNVEIAGLAQSTAAIANNTFQTVFTLPAGYRPSAQIIARGIISSTSGTTGTQSAGTAHTHVVVWQNKNIRINIDTAGVVAVYIGHPTAAYNQTTTGAVWLGLTGISFPVA